MSVLSENARAYADLSENARSAALAEALQALRVEQLRLAYGQTPIAVIGSMGVAIFSAITLKGHVPTAALSVWLLLTATVYFMRYLLARAYQRGGQAVANDYRRWATRFYVSTFGGGAVWGLCGLWLVPDQLAYQIFVVLVVVGLGAATTVTFSPLRFGSASFVLPSILPFAIGMLQHGEPLHQSMGILILLLTLVLLVAGHVSYRNTLEVLRLATENSGLVRYLELANAETGRLNRELRGEVEERAEAEQRTRRSEQELKRILDTMQDTYYRTDPEGRLVSFSASAEQLLGYRAEDINKVHLADAYIDPHGREKFLTALQAGGGRVQNYVAELQRKDGSRIWVSTNAQLLRDEHGALLGVEGTTRDITDLKRAEEALRREERRALVTLESIGDGVITTDTNGYIHYLNTVAETLTGWHEDFARGRRLAEVFVAVDENSREALADPVTACLRAGRSIRLPGHPVLLRHNDDREFSIEVTASPIRGDDESLSGVVLVFHDVTELRGLAREMSYQATHDALTGLINRREFELRLERALDEAAEGAAEHAVLYLDLDQFKVVNDTCGHQAGDQLLVRLAAQLQGCVRETDTLARLGGDEFGVLLEHCPLDMAESIAESLRGTVQRFRFTYDGRNFDVGVSIGLVPLNPASGSLADVLSSADAACYVAKDMGRNRVHVFRADDSALARHHGQMQWAQRLRAALDEGRLVLYAQPAAPVEPAGDDLQYCEILLRLHDEEGALVTPMAFIPAAERYHLMPTLDRWVVGAALDALAQRRLPANSLVAVNLSGQSLSEESFLRFVVDGLDRSGVDPEQICFEITETAAIANLAHATKFMNVLRGMGCRFALDDFGSGLSSFGYLKKLAVDFLKIDGHFVVDMHTDRIARAMVEAINQIGHVSGARTIAEFVENGEILFHLRKLGVDFAQGYGIARPAPLAEILARAPFNGE